MKNLKIFSCLNSIELSKKVVKKLNIEMGKNVVSTFSDGEIQPKLKESVSGKNVFVIQSITPPAENILELGLLGSSLSSAKQRILILTYMGYSRQDRKDKPGVPIGAKFIADIISGPSNFDKVVCLDLHAEQIEGFFSIPVKHISAGIEFVPYIKSLNLPNLLIASPDNGGTKRASEYSNSLGVEMITCYKFRPSPNSIGDIKILGDVRGKNIILIDDIIDTAGSITKVSDKMMEEGALSVRACVTHPVLSGNAFENIRKSKLSELIVTDSIHFEIPDNMSDLKKKIKILSLDNMISSVIKRLNKNKGLDSHFNLRQY
jgi:ribose-phosphate pyrophosphokinase